MPSFSGRILVSLALLGGGAGTAAAQQAAPSQSTSFFGRFFGGTSTQDASQGSDQSSSASLNGIPQSSYGSGRPAPVPASQTAQPSTAPSTSFFGRFFGGPASPSIIQAAPQDAGDESFSSSLNGVPRSSYGSGGTAAPQTTQIATPRSADTADAAPDTGEQIVVHRTRDRCAAKGSDAWACYR